MPPRFAYWTIIAGGLPTAFRTAERDELLPTFRRIQEKHPDAEMKYFARGRLWASAEEARAAAEARRAAQTRQRDSGQRNKNVRGRDWRPGGDHRDPRQKFEDAKKARNLERRRRRFERRQPGGPVPGESRGPAAADAGAKRQRPPRKKPHGDPLRQTVQRHPDRGRPHGPGRARPSRPGGSRGRR